VCDFLRHSSSMRGPPRSRRRSALNVLLAQHSGEHFAIASHGTALSTLFHHFDPAFGFEDFWALVDRLPFVVRARFQGQDFLEREDLA